MHGYVDQESTRFGEFASTLQGGKTRYVVSDGNTLNFHTEVLMKFCSYITCVDIVAHIVNIFKLLHCKVQTIPTKNRE